MGLLVCFLCQMMAGISGSCYPVILKLKSSIKNRSSLKQQSRYMILKESSSYFYLIKLLIKILYQVCSNEVFLYMEHGVQLTQKVPRDHQAIQVKTTRSPSCSEVPVKCIGRQESRKIPQMLHPHIREKVANLRFLT